MTQAPIIVEHNEPVTIVRLDRPHSNDAGKGIGAFITKRKPVWSGT